MLKDFLIYLFLQFLSKKNIRWRIPYMFSLTFSKLLSTIITYICNNSLAISQTHYALYISRQTAVISSENMHCIHITLIPLFPHKWHLVVNYHTNDFSSILEFCLLETDINLAAERRRREREMCLHRYGLFVCNILLNTCVKKFYIL